MSRYKKKDLGKFLIIGQRGGRYWLRGRRHSLEDATAAVKSMAYVDNSTVQNTYHVAEIKISETNRENYNPRRPK